MAYNPELERFMKARRVPEGMRMVVRDYALRSEKIPGRGINYELTVFRRLGYAQYRRQSVVLFHDLFVQLCEADTPPLPPAHASSAGSAWADFIQYRAGPAHADV